MAEKHPSEFQAFMTKTVGVCVVAGILGGIALVTRVEVINSRVIAVEADLAHRAEDGERLARIEQRLENLADLLRRSEDQADKRYRESKP